MKATYDYLYFPLALWHIGTGQMTAAKECLQIALQSPVSSKLRQHLATTTAHWAMGRPKEKRQANVDALLMMLNEMRQSALGHRIINQVHHTWAFEAYAMHEWPEVGRQVFDAVITKPALIRDRGLLSIWVRSALERFGVSAAPESLDAALLDGDHVDRAATARQRVEMLLGAPVHDWRQINSFTPINPRHYLYVFGDAHGHWVVRQAVSGNVQPATDIMQRVADAGVPVPACRIEQLGFSHTPGLRIESFLEGDRLDLNCNTPRETTSLVQHLGEAMQRLHEVPVHDFGLLREDSGVQSASPNWLREHLDLETLKALLWMDESIAPQQRVNLTANALNLLDDCPYTGPAVLCHGDLNPGNILVQKDRLTGLIDWDTVQGSDPAHDCAYFLMCTCSYWHPTFGNAFIEQVVEAFLGHATPELMCRVKAYMLLFMLQEWNLAVLYSDVEPWRDVKRTRDFLLSAHA